MSETNFEKGIFAKICKWFILVIVLTALLTSLVSSSAAFAGNSATTQTTSSHLLISEVFYNPTSGDYQEEWIEIYNPTSGEIDLSSYKVGDAETPSKAEGMYQFPAGAKIKAGCKIVVAVEANAFFNLYNKKPNFELPETDPEVPNMIKYRIWGKGGINLANTGDEVLLLDESDNPVDVVVYEKGTYPGVIPHPRVDRGHSIERSPANRDTDDCSADFIDQATPNPETEAPSQPPPHPGTNPDFSITLSATTLNLEQGKGGSTNVNLTSIDGFGSEVTVQVWGLPSSSTCSFDPSQNITPTGNTTLKIQTSSSTSVGSYLVLIMAVGGGKFHSCYLNLKVAPPPVDPATKPDFAISSAPQEQVVIPGGTTSFTLNLTSINGFASPVSLTVYGLPRGSTYSLNPNPVTPTGQSTLTINTTSQAYYGTYLALVSAVGTRGEVHFCYVRIRVVPAR